MDAVTICNMALGFFGGNRVESIDDDHAGDSDETSLCNTYFEPSLRAALEERAWLFATKFIDLGSPEDSPYRSLTGSDPLGSSRPLVVQFTIPNGVIKPLSCDDGSGKFEIEWERNGGLILSEDTVRLLCKAVMLIEDPNLWTPNFAFCVAYKLASIIAGPITQSAAIEEKMLAKYEEQLKKAAVLDGMQGATMQKAGIKSESLKNRRG